MYAEDEFRVFYDLEMQNKEENSLAKRSRYYQAEMDVSSFKPGEDFHQLRPSCIIFICTFDPFGKGAYRYVFEKYCKEEGISLGDETQKIFLNTKGTRLENVPSELVHFLHYVEESTEAVAKEAAEESVRRLHQRVQELKRRRELEVGYMRFEELLKDSRGEGKAEGRAEGKAESILELLRGKGEITEYLRTGIMSQQDDLFSVSIAFEGCLS